MLPAPDEDSAVASRQFVEVLFPQQTDASNLQETHAQASRQFVEVLLQLPFTDPAQATRQFVEVLFLNTGPILLDENGDPVLDENGDFISTPVSPTDNDAVVTNHLLEVAWQAETTPVEVTQHLIEVAYTQPSIDASAVVTNHMLEVAWQLPEPTPPTPDPAFTIKGLTVCSNETLLGDGQDLRVFLVTRGATAVLAEIKPTSGSFTRELDATSTLSMTGTVTGSLGDSCCEDWEDLDTWATEILVFRDGRDAWCGPVTDIAYNYGVISVEADDLTAWWDRRTVPTLSYDGVDLADIFVGVHEAAMEEDPSPNITIDAVRVGLRGSRSVLTTQYVYAVDILREIAETSLDYTAYGRNILVRGAEIDADPWLVLHDEHWTEPPTVRKRGNEQATRVVVRGEGVQSVATASAAYLDYYGLLTRTFDESSITDQASCDRAAQTRLDMLKDPLYIETPAGAKLKTSAPITLAQLIPGMRIRVDTQATCKKIVGDFRLQKVTVDFNGDVAIDLEPIGTIDSLEEAV